MGQIAQAAQGQHLQKARPQDGMQRLIEKSWPRIASVLPRHMSSERMFQLALSAYNGTPRLAECSPQSVLSCLMKCSALGLEPSNVDGLGRAYIIPYRNKGRMEAQFQMGYKGMIDLARRSGQLVSIHAQAVYEGDEFSYWEDMDGQHFSFRANLDATHSRDTLRYVYMLAKLKDGGSVFQVMSKAEVEDVRKRSKAKDSGPWVTDYEAMALKTVIRRSFKYLPVSVEAQQAAVSDETTPDYSSVLAPVVEAPAEDVPVDAPEGVDPETGEVMQDAEPEQEELPTFGDGQ